MPNFSNPRAVGTALVSVCLLGMGTGADLVGVEAARSNATGTASIDTVAGIALVGHDAIQARAETESDALAFDAALQLAIDNADDFAYPWLDTKARTLEVAPATAKGEQLIADDKSLSGSDLEIERREAPTTIAKLGVLADDVTRLHDAGFPGSELIWRTEPDELHNRIVITISKLDEKLISSLAERFGTDRIEVRVEEGGPASAMSRDDDYPPFYGGAFWSAAGPPALNCTTGFAWNAGTYDAMVSAGHCIPNGGNASYPHWQNIGSVASGSEENWSTSTGTQYLSGQTVYRGDIALIRYRSGGSSSPHIYSGAPHTSNTRQVAVMNPRWSQVGDAIAVNGVVHGEWSGLVTYTNANVWYLVNGINVWGRHLQIAEALGPDCPEHGDSGAPVYQKRADGKVIAFGVFSGDLPIGVDCEVYFTDIRDAYYGFPGTLKVTG